MEAGSVLLDAILVCHLGDCVYHKATSARNWSRSAGFCSSYICLSHLSLREWVRVWINIRIRERPVTIPKLSRQVREPLETRIATVLMPKGHGQHAGHDDLHTMKTLGGMFWRSLVHHNNVDPSSSIM